MASADELQRVHAGCSQRAKVNFGRSAKEWLRVSGTPEYQLRGGIIRHIKENNKVFHKFQEGKRPALIPDDVQANVTISEGLDIYVEIGLDPDDMITIYAHDHRPGPRLPQT